MNIPNFTPRPDVFSENEKIFLREMVKHLDEACSKCRSCEVCIFSRFCDEENGTPSDELNKIISILGVSKD